MGNVLSANDLGERSVPNESVFQVFRGGSRELEIVVLEARNDRFLDDIRRIR